MSSSEHYTGFGSVGGYLNEHGVGNNGRPAGITGGNGGDDANSSRGANNFMSQQQQQQQSHQLSSLQFHEYNMAAASQMSSHSAAQLQLLTAARMGDPQQQQQQQHAANFMGGADDHHQNGSTLLGQFQQNQVGFGQGVDNMKSQSLHSKQQQESPTSNNPSTHLNHPQTTTLSPPQQSHFVFDGYAGWVCRHCSHLTHYYRGPNYVWMGGQNPPPAHFVEAHLSVCPSLNGQPWACRQDGAQGVGGAMNGGMMQQQQQQLQQGGGGGQQQMMMMMNMPQMGGTQENKQSNTSNDNVNPTPRDTSQQQQDQQGSSLKKKRTHTDVVSTDTNTNTPANSSNGRDVSLQGGSTTLGGDSSTTNNMGTPQPSTAGMSWSTNNNNFSSGMFSQWPSSGGAAMGGMGGGGMPQGIMGGGGMSQGMGMSPVVGGGGVHNNVNGMNMNHPFGSSTSPSSSSMAPSAMTMQASMMGDNMPPTPGAGGSNQPGIVHTGSVYPPSLPQDLTNNNSSSIMTHPSLPPKTKKARRTTTTPKKVKPTPIHTGIHSTDEDYAKTLSLLRKKAQQMPPLPPSITGCNDKINLIEDGDDALLTDYFYYIMLQLSVCRLTEKDRKTRGGKRQDVAVGYGGLQCIHCASSPSGRKFFWSNVDRLANSFAGIPDHVLTCKMCPKDVVEGLLVLKGRHNVQMSCLTRGSQKHFFRKMWKRLHDGDGAAAAASSSVGGAVGGGGGGGGSTAASLKVSFTTADVQIPPSLDDNDGRAAETLKKSITQSPQKSNSSSSSSSVSVPLLPPRDDAEAAGGGGGSGPAFIPV